MPVELNSRSITQLFNEELMIDDLVPNVCQIEKL